MRGPPFRLVARADRGEVGRPAHGQPLPRVRASGFQAAELQSAVAKNDERFKVGAAGACTRVVLRLRPHVKLIVSFLDPNRRRSDETRLSTCEQIQDRRFSRSCRARSRSKQPAHWRDDAGP